MTGVLVTIATSSAAVVASSCSLAYPLGSFRADPDDVGDAGLDARLGARLDGGSCDPKHDLCDVLRLSAGTNHTCALRVQGDVLCWGTDESGTLGDEGFAGASSVVPVHLEPGDVTPIPKMIALAGGERHTCAIASDTGGVWCWGSDGFGQLGRGVEDFAAFRPGPASVVTGATSISAGHGHSCAVARGDVYCWGLGDYGALGLGHELRVSVPTKLAGVSDARLVDVGEFFSCAITGSDAASALSCWGLDGAEQLAHAPCAPTCASSTPCCSTAVPAALGAGVSPRAVSVGVRHACAVAIVGDASALFCWGDPADGATGIHGSDPKPHRVMGTGEGGALDDVVAVDTGGSGTCVLRRSGAVWCFGNGVAEPKAVSGIADATAIAVGGSHACAVVEGGRVVCWGENAKGELGNGDTMHAASASPVVVKASSIP